MNGGLGGHTGIVVNQLDIALQAVSASEVLHPGQEEGGGGLAVDALLPALRHSLVNGTANHVRVHGVLLRNGVGHQHTALEAHLPLGIEGLRQLLGGVQAVVHAKADLRV